MFCFTEMKVISRKIRSTEVNENKNIIAHSLVTTVDSGGIK